ncbi:MAG: ACP S-malonyltransferase [Firmicutes bacterium]|nr:ACP S-malonyltransferase [Bacillota bacterium]MCL5038327.1 ACP S-malonyltransferase [Bacillota bacterium]
MTRIGFLYPGQGTQYVGMGKELYQNFAQAREVFEEASDALHLDMKKLCFDGPEELLTQTANTQPAILTMSLAAHAALTGMGLQPQVAGGLSLGEYSALVAAGAMDFSDAVRLVRKRGELMEQAVPRGVGGMAAIIGLDRPDVEEICQRAGGPGAVEPANYNCPGQIVISGEMAALKRAVELAREKGAKRSVVLNVSGPFHSSLMAPAAGKLQEAIERTRVKDAQIPVYTNVDARPVQGREEIIAGLVKQVSSPVLWEDSIRAMLADGIDLFLEVGPGRTLSGFLKRIDKEARAINIDDRDSMERALEYCKEVC